VCIIISTKRHRKKTIKRWRRELHRIAICFH